VAGIEERIGQKVHNLLLDRLNPRGRPAAPRYTLSVRTGLSTSELGLQINEVATRAKLSLNASFVLTDDRSGRVLLKGNVRSINSYNIPNSQYAKVTAEADSANRAAREISNQIKSRLEIYFSRKGS